MDHISDSFLETNVPLLVLIEAAKSGNEKEVKEYAQVFREHANKLVEVSRTHHPSTQLLTPWFLSGAAQHEVAFWKSSGKPWQFDRRIWGSRARFCNDEFVFDNMDGDHRAEVMPGKGLWGFSPL